MAALSILPSCYCKHTPVTVLRTRSNSRMPTIVSCQARNPNPDDPDNEEIEQNKVLLPLHKSIIHGVGNLGKGLRENLSPQRKGDWKDITLMSLSFAVYVYMSQKIVCAYCLWMSMSRQSW